MDGVVEAWDLLQQQNEPVLTMKVCDEPINCIRSHESGNLSVGSQKGVMYLIEVSENMKFSAKNEKPLFTAMLERESKREKILEGKLREIKLKNKTTALKVEEETEELRQSRLAGLDRACNQAKADYFKVVERIRASRSPDKSKGNKLPMCSSRNSHPISVNYNDYDEDEVALAIAADDDDLDGDYASSADEEGPTATRNGNDEEFQLPSTVVEKS